MNNYRQAYKLIKKARKVTILPHKDADGDAIGCAFAMKLIIENMPNKLAKVVMEEVEPHRLLGAVCDGGGGGMVGEDLVICVDSADLGRLGDRAGLVTRGHRPTICFDHHQSCTKYADINCVVSDAGACAEVIYEFCRINKITITPEIANNLYLALSSDTGGFRQSNASPKSMEIAADLMHKGANAANINTALFLSDTIEHMRLICEVLKSLEFSAESGISSMFLTLKQIEECGASMQETDGLVNFARDIIGVKIAIFLREKEDGAVKASLRSNDDLYDLSEFCSRFGGGGHKRAAGCEFGMTEIRTAPKKAGCEFEGADIQAVREKIVKAAEEYIGELRR